MAEEPTPAAPGRAIANCHAFEVNYAPFSGAVAPNELTEAGASLQVFDAEDDEWFAISRSGWPVLLNGRGESAVSTWTYIASSAPATLEASWFDNDVLRGGIRAQATTCRLVLTERGIRFSLASADKFRDGLWLTPNGEDKLRALKDGRFVGGVINYEEITAIAAAKKQLYVQVGILGGLEIPGKVQTPDGGLRGVGANELASCLVDMMIDWYANQATEGDEAIADRLATFDVEQFSTSNVAVLEVN